MPRGGDGEAQPGGDLGPLPGGHHGLSRKEVTESQRERLLAATAVLIGERGYAAVPITEISKQASVANRIFYANFASKEEAFTAAFDVLADHLGELIATAARAEETWPAQVIAALCTATEFLDAEPALARFLLIAPFTATQEIADHCRERVAAARPYLAQGRSADGGEELPASTEDSLLGGVITQLSRASVAGSAHAPLFGDLVEFVLSPYLGTRAARKLAAKATA